MDTSNFKFYFVTVDGELIEADKVLINKFETDATDLSTLDKRLIPHIIWCDKFLFEFEIKAKNKYHFNKVIIKENDEIKFVYSYRGSLMNIGDVLTISWTSHCIMLNTVKGHKLCIGHVSVKPEDLPIIKKPIKSKWKLKNLFK